MPSSDWPAADEATPVGPFKDGKNGGKLNKIMLPDGRSIEGG
jgi:hypothetical protein